MTLRSAARARRRVRADEWVTGTPYDWVVQNYPYIHVIRAKNDPAETYVRGRGGPNPTTSWRKLDTGKRANIERMADAIVELLGDSTPRTFNRIAVELFGRTADVVFQKDPDKALWLAVERGDVEHTLKAPILFRRAS